MAASPIPSEGLEKLLNFSGFPEPFLHATPRFISRWSQDYLDRVVREDIGSLTRIIDREYILLISIGFFLKWWEALSPWRLSRRTSS